MKTYLILSLSVALALTACKPSQKEETETEEIPAAELQAPEKNVEDSYCSLDTLIGKKFIDFEADYAGQVLHLSDYVGHGKYVLVDFWASWCGPCKEEIPNLIKIQNELAGDRLIVLGVPSGDDPADTKAAMDELGVNYPQMMNAQSAGVDAYGIEGIPEIMLFSPDGTLLKRGLRGDDIRAAVKEALAKK